MYESFGLTQLISEPTRETEQTSTLIDHIAVSNVRNISKSGVVRTAISDHYLVYAVRKHLGGIERKHKQIYTRQMKNKLSFGISQPITGHVSCIALNILM